MVQFSDQELAKVKEIISHYPDGKQKSALLPVLHLAQDSFGGWLSTETMDYVASLLQIEPIEVYEVATFYSMYNRNYVGKFHLQICGTTPCMVRGAKEVIDSVKEYLGVEKNHLTPDGMFSYSEVECLGACANAPMMQVNNELF